MGFLWVDIFINNISGLVFDNIIGGLDNVIEFRCKYDLKNLVC